MTTIDVERRGAVALVTINNPDAQERARRWKCARRCWRPFAVSSSDDEVRAVRADRRRRRVLLRRRRPAMGGRDLAGARARMKTMHAMIRAVHGLDKPVVAAVRGPAVGIGFGLAMACDVVVASRRARSSRRSSSEVGLAPDGGAIWFLARQMGFTRAKELVYSARRLGGDEAHALGLVPAPGAGGRAVLDEALELAREYAEGPALALAMAKQMFAAQRVAQPGAVPRDRAAGRAAADRRRATMPKARQRSGRSASRASPGADGSAHGAGVSRGSPCSGSTARRRCRARWPSRSRAPGARRIRRAAGARLPSARTGRTCPGGSTTGRRRWC